MMNDTTSGPSGRELMREAKRARHRAWLQLVRAPNLLTACGDPVAGACLAGALVGEGAIHRVLVAAVSSVAVYAAGLVDNDLVDLSEDQLARPHRPIPSGGVELKQARTGRVLLFAAPFLIAGVYRMPLSWWVVHAMLLLSTLGYNRLKGRSVALGALLMGLCRALSLASGVVLAWSIFGVEFWPLMAVLPWLGYVAGICLFAERETSRVPGLCRYLMLLPLLAMLPASRLSGIPPLAGWAVHAAAMCGAVVVLDVMWRLRATSPVEAVPPAVGRLVRALVPMQALLCLATPGYGVLFAILLMVCWIASERVSRRFYAS